MTSRTKKSKSHIQQPIWIEILSSPQITGLVVMFGIAFLIIYQMLPYTTRATITTITTYPLVTVFILSAIMFIGYFNWLAALFALAIFAYILTTFRRQRGDPYGSKIHEGFDSGDRSNDNGSDDEVADLSNTDDIKSLFQPGFLRRRLDDARKLTKEVHGETAARNKMERFLDRRMANNSNISNTSKERFNNNSKNGGDSAKAIQLRRFNPGSEEDANLLLAMDIMDDIKDRIKYKYEDKKYLKRYIKQKLEEVVDLLGLVDDDDE